MIRRFPKLHAGRAKAIVSEWKGLDADALKQQSRTLPEIAREKFAATGLPKISAEELATFRNQIEDAATSAGYPTKSLAVRQQVDTAIAVRLAKMDLPEGEMLRPEVWTWIAVHLMPHIVHWRFSKDTGEVKEERYLGILQRNALGRLWLRGKVFDRGEEVEDRWGLVDGISEDATVAILERTSVAGDWRLARVIGEAWLDAKRKGLAADDLLRDAVIRARISFAITELGIYNDEDLKTTIEECMHVALARKVHSLTN